MSFYGMSRRVQPSREAEVAGVDTLITNWQGWEQQGNLSLSTRRTELSGVRVDHGTQRHLLQVLELWLDQRVQLRYRLRLVRSLGINVIPGGHNGPLLAVGNGAVCKESGSSSPVAQEKGRED